MQKGSQASDAGYLLNLAENMIEFSIVFFNMYAMCYFELLLIQVGKLLNTSAGAGNFVSQIGYEIVEYYYAAVGVFVDLEVVLKTNDSEKKGKKMGIAFSDVMQW